MKVINSLIPLAAIPVASAVAINERAGGGSGAGLNGWHNHHWYGPGNKPPCDDCGREAQGFTWTVHGFDYHASYIFTTPAHQNSYGYVNFNLTNSATSYTAVCSATGFQLEDFFYGDISYPCTLPSTAPAGAAVSFKFNRPTGQLDLNETWICDSKGSKQATQYHEAGSTKLSLTCTDTFWQNPNWVFGSGEFYSDREIKCTPVDVAVKPGA